MDLFQGSLFCSIGLCVLMPVTDWNQGRNKKLSGNKWKWTYNSPKLMGHSKVSPEREIHKNTGLPKKDRKMLNKWPNPTSIRLE